MVHSFLMVADQELTGAWHAQTFTEALMSTAAFGALGIVLLFAGFKIFDLLLPKLDFEKELSEKNMPVALVVAAFLLSMAIIVAKSVG